MANESVGIAKDVTEVKFLFPSFMFKCGTILILFFNCCNDLLTVYPFFFGVCLILVDWQNSIGIS